MSAQLKSTMLQHAPTKQSTACDHQEGQCKEPGLVDNQLAFNGPTEPATLRLRLLGATPAFAVDTGPSQPVSLRTAEILALMSSRDRGCTASELSTEVDVE